MGRQIVVCCDGTWDVPENVQGGAAAPTNVAKLALALARRRDKQSQLLFYEPGVGTDPDDHLIGGAIGYGLSRNIRDCYVYLVSEFEAGDEIFLFGFSRGAYTARSLAGLIRNSGLLQKDHVDKVDAAFALYRDRSSRTRPNALSAEIFRAEYSLDPLEIAFVGVWDTVGALGIPAGMPGASLLQRIVPGWRRQWGFHDTELSKIVRHAAHALAIDEQRAPFQPTLWTNGPKPGQTLDQVWFSGSHCNVGGGRADTSLSDITLLWMIEQAKAAGLRFEPGVLAIGADGGVHQPIAPDYRGPIADTRTGLYEIMPSYRRLSKASVGRAPAQCIASSAARRDRERFGGYGPPGLAAYLREHPQVPVVEEPQPTYSSNRR